MDNDPIKTDIKLIVAHENPDLDAIAAIWLWLRFGGSDFEGATFYFVPAGNEIDPDTLKAKNLKPEEVVHVDTGMGPFDHHQPDNQLYDSATLRVYQYLTAKHRELEQDEALKRVVEFVNGTDHFESCYYPEATSDRYEFMLEQILKGLRQASHFNDRELVEFGMICLDGAYNSMKIKASAEEDIKTKAYEFESPWGRALAIENQNDEAIKLAQKQGYQVVVRKDEDQGHIRIKAVPQKDIDLTGVYEAIKAVDQTGVWFLHPAKTMLINNSKKNRQHVASPLTLTQVVEIIKQAKE